MERNFFFVQLLLKVMVFLTPVVTLSVDGGCSPQYSNCRSVFVTGTGNPYLVYEFETTKANSHYCFVSTSHNDCSQWHVGTAQNTSEFGSEYAGHSPQFFNTTTGSYCGILSTYGDGCVFTGGDEYSVHLVQCDSPDSPPSPLTVLPPDTNNFGPVASIVTRQYKYQNHIYPATICQ